MLSALHLLTFYPEEEGTICLLSNVPCRPMPASLCIPSWAVVVRDGSAVCAPEVMGFRQPFVLWLLYSEL